MLNEFLYRRLCRLCGQGNVLVVNEDVPLDADYARPAAAEGNRLVLRDVLYSGEEYRINCRFCSDTRQRLYINHTWGTYSTETGSRHLWLVQCYNCHFEHEFAQRQRLEQQVFGDILGQRRITIRKPTGQIKRRGPVTLPGTHWRVHQIAERNPLHECIQYLESRRYNPRTLGERYDVGFCPDAIASWARQRIVAPVYLDGRLVSWTARYLGDPPDKSIPKWAHASGSISQYIYNFDRMIRHRTIVLVEGPGDVWSFGVQAGALFGRVIRRPQLELLRQRCLPDTTIVVLLDPTMPEDDKRLGRVHHIERTYQTLQQERRFHGRVLPVYLPEPFDPGELDRWYMMDFIRWKAAQAGIPVDFTRQAARTSSGRPATTRQEKNSRRRWSFARR